MRKELIQCQLHVRKNLFLLLSGIACLYICALLFLLITAVTHTVSIAPTSAALIAITPQNYHQYLRSTGAVRASNLAGNSPYRTYQFTDYIYSAADHHYVSAELGYGGYSYAMLCARALSPSSQETFNWYYDYKTSTWQIQSVANGLFLSTQIRYTGSSYAMLRARTSSSKVFGYEQFHLYFDTATGDDVIQSARNGLYVSAELGYNGGNYAMLRARTSGTTIDVWEQFLV